MNFAPQIQFRICLLRRSPDLDFIAGQAQILIFSPARDNVPFSTLGMASGGRWPDGRDYDSRADQQHDYAVAAVHSGTFMVFAFSHSVRSSKGHGG